MKITFIGCKDNSIHFFKELSDNLSKKISNLVIEERFVPFIEDIPLLAIESSKESDMIFVFFTTDEAEIISLLKSKLIDVEMSTKTRILKGIENEISVNEEDYFEEKLNLAEKYSDLIVSILFDEKKFQPTEKDFL